MREFTYKWEPEGYTDDGPDPILKISKSSQGQFNWCPTKYEFNYRQKIPQTVSAAMAKGTDIHNAREDMFKAYELEKVSGDISKEDIIDYNYSLYPIDDHTDMYYAMAVWDAEVLLKHKESGTIGNFLPVANEVMLDAEYMVRKRDYDHVELQNNYVVHLQGIIDRVYFEQNEMFPEGTYIPFELKTGKWSNAPKKSTDMRQEMAFYKLLYDEASDADLAALGLDSQYDMGMWGWYFPTANHITLEKVKKVSTTSLKKKIASLIHAYEKNDFPAKYSEWNCPTCSYYEICPAADMAGWI